MPIWNNDEKKRFESLVKTATLSPGLEWYQASWAPKVIANKERYKRVAQGLGCPLVMVPLIHSRENGPDVGVFKSYLGNGQPLNKVTTIVPKGRGPFSSWEAGAIDALKLSSIDKVTEWSLERMLFELERFNGFGYRGRINTPYLWSHTNHYKSGLYVRDGVYSSSTVSKNPGCFALYLILVGLDKDFEVGAVERPVEPPEVAPIAVGEVYPMYGNDDAFVRAFQDKFGLVVDGIPGKKTWAKLKEV